MCDAEETQGVDDEAILGVDDDAPDTVNESEKIDVEQTNLECTPVTMNLHQQPRKQYNHKNCENVFNITDRTQNNGIMFMKLKQEEDSGTFDVTKDTFDEVEAEYLLLAETLGWKEGINGEDDTSSEAGLNDVTKLTN